MPLVASQGIVSISTAVVSQSDMGVKLFRLYAQKHVEISLANSPYIHSLPIDARHRGYGTGFW